MALNYYKKKKETALRYYITFKKPNFYYSYLLFTVYLLGEERQVSNIIGENNKYFFSFSHYILSLTFIIGHITLV